MARLQADYAGVFTLPHRLLPILASLLGLFAAGRPAQFGVFRGAPAQHGPGQLGHEAFYFSIETAVSTPSNFNERFPFPLVEGSTYRTGPHDWLVGGGGGWSCDGLEQGFLVGTIDDSFNLRTGPPDLRTSGPDRFGSPGHCVVCFFLLFFGRKSLC